MAFFTASKSAEDVKEDVGGGKYITKSGIYDINVIAPFVQVSPNGSTSVDFFVEYNGQKQVVYGNLRLTNNDGSENFGAATFNKFLVVTEVDAVSDPVDGSLPIGKEGALKDAAVLEDLADLDCKVRIQMEYGINPKTNSYSEKTVIKNFYSVTGATAEEIVNETEAGVQLEKDMAYADNITYKDGTTAEQITEWIAAKRPKGTAGGASSTAKKAPSFAKPKFGK